MKAKAKKIKEFNAAKEIALNIEHGVIQRASVEGTPVNYSGTNINGKYYVVGDSVEDLQNPDVIIDGKPAREVFDGFIFMSK